MSPRLWCDTCRNLMPHRRGVCQSCAPIEVEPVSCPETLALWPTTPPSNGVETSDAAAASLSPEALNSQQRAVLSALWRARPGGLTDQELQRITGIKESAERPRRGELVEMGWAMDSGEKRATDSGRGAIIWTVTERARRAIEAARRQKEAA